MNCPSRAPGFGVPMSQPYIKALLFYNQKLISRKASFAQSPEDHERQNWTWVFWSPSHHPLCTPCCLSTWLNMSMILPILVEQLKFNLILYFQKNLGNPESFSFSFVLTLFQNMRGIMSWFPGAVHFLHCYQTSTFCISKYILA